MEKDSVVQLVIDQVTEVQTEQPDLELALVSTGELIVRGNIRFSIDHNDRAYKDAYQIEITVPSDYPASLPTTRETGGAIPSSFHRFSNTGNLCLAAPVELVRVFNQERTLRNYINRLLIPYLFSYTYFREHGQPPHGELSHGINGLLEYYADYFAVGPVTARKFLKLLPNKVLPQLMACPCGRGRKLQECHGPKLDELRSLSPLEHFEKERREMMALTLLADAKLQQRNIEQKQMMRCRKKRMRKRAKRR